MGLFDKITENISQASSNISQKAKDLTKINELNGKIKNNKRSISEKYTLIGKTVFAEYKKTDFGEDLKSQCEIIAELNKEISELEKEINEIKNVKVCSKCGAKVDGDSAFCNVCGNPLKE